jgi:cysteine-rich repeat protein
MAAALGLFLVLMPTVGLADGTETLGVPGISIAAGTGIVAAGVGLESAQPANISIAVPADVTVNQVLLYWSQETAIGGDDTLNVGPAAVEVTGAQIGGPAFFFNFGGNAVDAIGFRADITNLGLVSPGLNTIAVGGLDSQVSTPGTGAHGASLLVIYDDGGALSEIGVVDGIDLAYCGFPEPRKSTVPQTIDYLAGDEDRIGQLVLFVGSQKENDPIRATEIRIAFDVGAPISLFNQLNGADGDLWETKTLDVPIPAGTSSATVSVQSANPAGTCPSDPRNGSVTWVGATLAVPTPPEPFCGDGITDDGEECDDGNDDNFDDCRNDCTAPFCGDGIPDAGEECDDGDDDNFDECRNDCSLPFCGDGTLDPGEECDDGDDDNFDECRNDCSFPICGDGIPDPGEECDDGDNDNFDECRNDCSAPFCGDGIPDPGEECDDGDNDNFDECRNDCSAPFCGDGILDPGEECDDGNNQMGDGCSPVCTEEQGGEGCTPGYWRQGQHLGNWVVYSPTDSYDAVFGVDAPGDLNLLEAVHQGGGDENALSRHSVAALLNSTNSDVSYLFSTAEVIQIVRDAYASGDFEGAKNLLSGQNEQFCPLRRARGSRR